MVVRSAGWNLPFTRSTSAFIAARWFDAHNIRFLLPVPVLVLASVWGIFRAVDQRREQLPFRLALCLMFFGYSGFSSASGKTTFRLRFLSGMRPPPVVANYSS